MKFTAVIPVKANSSRLPGKNLKPFGNENLLTRKIRQIKTSKIADRIIVSSDSLEMIDIAKNMGVEGILRPLEFADESRPFGEFLIYLTDLIQDGHLIYACVTSPFLDENLMIKTKEKYLWALENGYDSLITIYKFKHYLMDKNGPLNFKTGLNHLNSEYLPSFDLFTNGINFAPIDKVREWYYNYGPKAYRFEVNQKEAADIDTLYDYLAALAWLETESNGGGVE